MNATQGHGGRGKGGLGDELTNPKKRMTKRSSVIFKDLYHDLRLDQDHMNIVKSTKFLYFMLLKIVNGYT